MAHIKKNDEVIVLTGKYASREPKKVLSVDPKNSKCCVEGVNVVKRATKPSQKFPQGGLIEKTLPIHISNVMVVCPKCHKPTRPVTQVETEGTKTKRYRACCHCSERF